MVKSGNQVARGVLVLDGVGCLVSSVAVAASPRLVGVIDESMRSRPWIVGALAATGTMMTAGGLRSGSPTALRSAAVANAGWVAGCALAVPGRTGWGLRLVSATALLDATMGVLQLHLAASSSAQR